MTTLTRLSMYDDPPEHMTNETRLQLFRRVWHPQVGNGFFRFNYGGGGVESRHASEQPHSERRKVAAMPASLCHSTSHSRSIALPASTYRERSVTEQGACMQSASFMEQDTVEKSRDEILVGLTDSRKPVQVRQRINTNKFHGVNARARGECTTSAVGTQLIQDLSAAHGVSEMSTEHSTLSRSQSVSSISLPVGGLAPFLSLTE